MAKVLNKRTDKIPPDAVYVGRPSKWGNPWKIGEHHPRDGHRLTREEAIELHRSSIRQMVTTKRGDGSTIIDISELRGRDLVCWCAPFPCHADVLLELANA